MFKVFRNLMDRIQVILNFFFGEFESETDFERAKV